MYNPYSLGGKTILVTGASSGIGRSVAIECSRMGAIVIITGRNSIRLQETYDSLEGEGHAQIIFDLMNTKDISSLVDGIPPLDGIVHSAGLTKPIPFQFIDEESLTSIMNVNFVAPTLISQSILKKRKLNKGASIIFISSISGILCSAVAESLYSASKGAVNGIVKAMAIELSAKGIRVNSVNPGVIETPIFSEGMISSEQLIEGVKKYPLKRYGRPEEVAYAVIYLLSDTTKWITGTNLVIDGGYTLL
jgi:NAD(P)-dependent dehydrogenase (short-subunit alcohol dehydrogenase family)